MAKEHIDQLHAARKRLVEDRRQSVRELSESHQRGRTDDLREKLITVQQAIAAVDDALEDEKRINSDVE
jgi:hypothetical protein